MGWERNWWLCSAHGHMAQVLAYFNHNLHLSNPPASTWLQPTPRSFPHCSAAGPSAASRSAHDGTVVGVASASTGKLLVTAKIPVMNCIPYTPFFFAALLQVLLLPPCPHMMAQ